MEVLDNFDDCNFLVQQVGDILDDQFRDDCIVRDLISIILYDQF